ncbi:hypothetical protein Tco_0571464 [Tanacetum coccineum]
MILSLPTARDYMQKAKILWDILVDENSNFFHGIINHKRANLAIKGVMVDGKWVDEPVSCKEGIQMCLELLVSVLNGAHDSGLYTLVMARSLLKGSPTSESNFIGAKSRRGFCKGIKIGSSLNISHLFYADDAVFIGEWSIANLSGITHILHCFSLLSGLSINLKKSHLLRVGIRSEDVNAAALYFGCSTMKTPLILRGVMVGGNSSTLQAWDDTIGKLKARLSNWKLKTVNLVEEAYSFKEVCLVRHLFIICPSIRVHLLKDRGVDSILTVDIRVGNGFRTQILERSWIGDTQLRLQMATKIDRLRMPQIKALKFKDLAGKGSFFIIACGGA